MTNWVSHAPFRISAAPVRRPPILDPRSVVENTEIGVVLTSPEVAGEMGDWFDENVATRGFRLELVKGRSGAKRSDGTGSMTARLRSSIPIPDSGVASALALWAFCQLSPNYRLNAMSNASFVAS